MIPYFENIDHWNTYYEELQGWDRTPYRHMTNIKGRGADCTLFIASTLKNVGIITKIEFTDYPADWHYHQHESLVEKSYENGSKYLLPGLSMNKIEGLPETLLRGDIFLLSAIPSGIVHHASVCIDKHTMIHCIQPRGVQVSSFEGWWQRHIKHTIRIMEDNT